MAGYASFVETHFEIVRSRCTAEELVFICPESGCSDSSGNRSVNLKTGLTNCWKCGKGGPIEWWAKSLGLEVDVTIATQGLDTLEELAETLSAKAKPTGEAVRSVQLPAGFERATLDPTCGYSRLIGRMARRKNLVLEDLIAVGVGFTRSHRTWEPYAIFPVQERKLIVYWQGRTYADPPGGVTKRFPNKQECPVGSSHWVYNIDSIPLTRPSVVIVVESILNVLSLQKALKQHGIERVIPVAVFKHNVSPKQVEKLIGLKQIKEICIMFDADAVQNSWSVSAKMGNICPISVATIPSTNGRTQDPNDDAEAALEAFVDRKPWSALEHHVLSGSL